MNDIEKAIDVLKRLRIATTTSNIDGFRVLEPLTMAISALEKQLNGCWIPVSERLPKENEEVLITLAHGKATWAYLYQGKWHTMFSAYPIERVIAWQPLPEPYKEVENE